MGGVSLLLWDLHMVQSGIMRAFGPDLRRLLLKALPNRFAAFGTGLALTATAQVVATDLRSVGDTLLAAAAEHDAGLLVMGAYSHSRLREMFWAGPRATF